MDTKSAEQKDGIQLRLNISHSMLEYFFEQVKKYTSEHYIREFKAEYILNGKSEEEAQKDYYPFLSGALGAKLNWIKDHLEKALDEKEKEQS